MIFMFRNMDLVRTSFLDIESRQQKYLMMRHLAHDAVRYGADAVILVGEVWTTPADALKPYEFPAESQNRREGLSLTLARKEGDPLHYFSEISRDGDQVSLGEVVFSNTNIPSQFAPFYAVWGRPLQSD